jgi:hypothetical protein
VRRFDRRRRFQVSLRWFRQRVQQIFALLATATATYQSVDFLEDWIVLFGFQNFHTYNASLHVMSHGSDTESRKICDYAT